MRFTHILVTFATIIAATACSFSEIEDMNTRPENASQYLQVVGRIAQYSDCDVATRSKKEGDEPKVTSMGLALFPFNDDGSIGNCLYYDFQLGGSIVFIVDRHDAIFNNYVDKPFAMYIFANMQDAVGFPKTAIEGVGKSLDDFTKYAANTNVNVKDVPQNGFPMMGSLGNTNITQDQDADGIKLILKPTANGNNVDGLPLVNDTPTDNLEIPLKSMYAKFTFTISVKPDQEILGNKAPRFDLLSYEVNNIALNVDANSSTNNDNNVFELPVKVSMGSYAQGATTANFNFYLPERYLSPSINISDVLPDELKSANADEREKYQQRYKNKLVDGKAATYVTINGKYTDHQGHVYDVDYNIYLGGNNYNDFNIIRNTHYDNNITIRGISASDEQTDNEEAISIDWRVNVNRSTPLVIGLRRETLLDAHYEVRPLRLRLVGENIPEGTSATVQLLNEDGKSTSSIPSWIRLELSGSSPTDYITSGLSAGKRKYFTTNLVTETLERSTSATVENLDENNQTVWIYVDENTTTESRAAIVRVTYDNEPQDYKIVQHGLYAVTSTDGLRTYYIERYEEYLYNFDTADLYGQTKEEGMPWGLDGVQLSKEHLSFEIDEDNTQWKNYIKNNPSHLLYDFYTLKQDKALMIDAGFTDLENKDACHKEYAGQHFTEKIYNATKDNTDTDKKVNVLTMADSPKGAVEYCYNRNKRDANGNVVKVEWYLPSADELEDFIVPAYSTFKEFQNNYYWTSQPAYIRNIFYYELKARRYIVMTYTEDAYSFKVYEDNKTHARATKVVYNGRYEPVPSGLKEKPDSERTDKPWGNDSQLLGYFNEWHAWKKTPDNQGVESTLTREKEGNAVYTEYNNSTVGGRYAAYLGHLEDLKQEGYHERTKSNRVRCVYKKTTNQ